MGTLQDSRPDCGDVSSGLPVWLIGLVRVRGAGSRRRAEEEGEEEEDGREEGRMTELEEGREGGCAIRQIVNMSRARRLFQHSREGRA